MSKVRKSLIQSGQIPHSVNERPNDDEGFLSIALPSNQGTNLQSASNFSFQINPPIELPGKWVVALANYSFWNTIKNISVALNNNFLYWRSTPLGSDNLITIPDGAYNITSLNAIIQTAISEQGGIGTNVELIAYPNELNTAFLLNGQYTINLTSGNLNVLLGFNKEILTPVSTTIEEFVSEDYANFQPNVTTVNFLVDSFIDTNTSYFGGNASNVIYTTSIQTQVNLQQAKDVNPFQFVNVVGENAQISKITVSIVDQNFQQIDFSQGNNYNNNASFVKLYFYRIA